MRSCGLQGEIGAIAENLVKRFSGRMDNVLAAYNAGPSPVQTWNERYGDTAGLLAIDLIPYKETRLYVSII
ncbi:MAG: transglycosylase SLT domain-containing protein, partial [bacterium]